VHFLSHSVTTAFRFDEWLVEKVGEIIDVPVCAENHISAAATVAAIRSTSRHEFLSPKTDRAAATASSLHKNFDSIDKHYSLFRQTIGAFNRRSIYATSTLKLNRFPCVCWFLLRSNIADANTNARSS
jgi:hypothetical protein